MPRITLRIPEGTKRGDLHISKGDAILVGRNPDAKLLGKELLSELAEHRLRLHAVNSSQVSQNHLLLRCDEHGVFGIDLRSRNGTWMRAPSAHWTCLAEDADTLVELALTSGWFVPSSSFAIPRSDWKSPTEYSDSVVDCLRRWLSKQGIVASVERQSELSSKELDSFWTLPLADGAQLRVDWPPQTTQEHSVHQLQDQIAAYVHAENQRFESLCDHDPGVVFCSPLIRVAHDRVVDAALQGQRLVLIGPTGSGKEILAQCLHRHSSRKGKPFVAVNCAQLRDEWLYAQLFGAKRGSFTGAVTDLSGLVDAAHGGTLFLDELAEMDANTQRALLRFLDRRGEYFRLGDVRARYADVHVVCATSTDLAEEKSRAGCFREDLWYRLAVRIVHVPALSQRPDDLIAFLRTRKTRGGMCSVFDALTESARHRLLAQTWPGNFRDVENFLQRLPAHLRPGSIDLAQVDQALMEGVSRPGVPFSPAEPESSGAQLRGPRVTPLDEESWSAVLHEAIELFLADNAGPPRGWGQIHSFTERYLKPIFVARSTGLRGAVELPDMLNYSKLARQLGVSDGTTIKSHLHRYVSLIQDAPRKRRSVMDSSGRTTKKH